MLSKSINEGWTRADTFSQLIHQINESPRIITVTEDKELTAETLCQVNFIINPLGGCVAYWNMDKDGIGDRATEEYMKMYLTTKKSGHPYTYGNRIGLGKTDSHFNLDQVDSFFKGNQQVIVIWDPINDSKEPNCPCLNLYFPKEDYVLIRSNDMKDAFIEDVEGMATLDKEMIIPYYLLCKKKKRRSFQRAIESMTLQSNSAHFYSLNRRADKEFTVPPYFEYVIKHAERLKFQNWWRGSSGRVLIQNPDINSDYFGKNNLVFKGVLHFSEKDMPFKEVARVQENLKYSHLGNQITNYKTTEDWFDYARQMNINPTKGKLENGLNQLEYVVDKLVEAPTTRRAVITPGDPRTGVFMNPYHVQFFNRNGLYVISTLYKAGTEEIRENTYLAKALGDLVSEKAKVPWANGNNIAISVI